MLPRALEQAAARLADRLDTRVKITMGKRKGRMTVEFATREDLERISAGWKAWSRDRDGVFVVPRGAILCRV